MSNSHCSLLLGIRCSGIIALSVIPASGNAQDFAECSFNGHWEECDLTRLRSSGTESGVRVRWLSDGKTVDYFYSNCMVSAGGTVHQCQVKIVEDNGRVTHGSMTSSGRGTHVKSRLGNKTVIPPFE